MITIEPFFFGVNERQFGVFHPPTGGDNGQSVLICPPFLGEEVRAHWTLREIAEKLSAKGYSVLRFNYMGMGNSKSSIEQVTLDTLAEDISQAYLQMQRLAGRSTVISIFAARLSAALVCHTNLSSLDKMIFWDPLFSGQAWLNCAERINTLVSSTLGQRNFKPREYFAQILSGSLVSSLQMLETSPSENTDTYMLFGATEGSIPTSDDRPVHANIQNLRKDYSWEIYDLELIYGHEVVKATLELF